MNIDLRTMVFFSSILWLSGYVLNKPSNSTKRKEIRTLTAFLCGIPYSKRITIKSFILQFGGIASLIVGILLLIIKSQFSLFISMVIYFITVLFAGLYEIFNGSS